MKDKLFKTEKQKLNFSNSVGTYTQLHRITVRVFKIGNNGFGSWFLQGSTKKNQFYVRIYLLYNNI